eukprot:3308052-Amphidinium_carterae.1
MVGGRTAVPGVKAQGDLSLGTPQSDMRSCSPGKRCPNYHPGPNYCNSSSSVVIAMKVRIPSK